MQDDEQVPVDDLEHALSRYTQSLAKLIRVQTDTGTKIVEAVREFLHAIPVGGEDLDKEQIITPAGPTAAFALGRLVDNSAELGQLGQLQSLQMLAAVIRWFSIESGRSEAEILERLGECLSDFESFGRSIEADVTQSIRDIRRDSDA